MRKILAGLAAASAVALAAGALAPAANAADGTQSLAAVLTSDGGKQFDNNHKDFDIVTEAVLAVLAAKPDSSVKVLTDGSVALTAFVPDDKAFMHLVHSLTGKLPKLREEDVRCGRRPRHRHCGDRPAVPRRARPGHRLEGRSEGR